MSGRRDHEPGQRGRTEPRLGDLDHLDEPAPAAARDELPSLVLDPERRRAAPPRQPAPPRPRKRGWLVPLAALVLIGLGTVAWLQQDRLRGLIPNTALNDVLGRADQALQNGRLDGNDGTSARELYEAARALEPDNDRAHDGLRKVGQAEIARADAALAAGRLDEAEQALATARDLLGGGADVDRLSQALAKAHGAQVQTASLVEQARQALDAGRLDGADGAGALYQRVLAADPNNAVAAHGLDQVGDALAAQARKALDGNDLKGASALVDKLAALLPGHAELPSLRAALAQAGKQRDDALADALRQGQDDLRAGRFSGEGDDNALARFKAALAIDPGNAEAQAGLGQVAQALIVQADAALDGGDADQAARLLDQAAALAPKSADLAAARARLHDRGGANHAAAGGDGTGRVAEPAGRDEAAAAAAPAPLSPQQSAQVADMLRRAQAAAERGDIMLPPGDSAYDLYRGALAIDGNNEAARQGLEDLPNRVARAFDQALGNGNLGRAGEMLANLGDLSPGDAGLAGRRQRLANAWLDQAEQQLGRGDRANAAQSLEQARKLAPGNPRAQELLARLQQGR
jgi:tetratricopeptide (TPR) repeat protein